MSHGDRVTAAAGFNVIARTDRMPVARWPTRPALVRRAVPSRSHPHQQGEAMLRRFVVDICGCATLWTAANIIEDQIARVREQVGSDEVILGLSGGVDSSVVAALLHRAIGEQLTCVFVDTGLLRWQEGDQVMAMFAENMGVKVIRVNAADRYFKAGSRASRSGSQAQDHRQPVRRDLRRGIAKLKPTRSGWRRARSTRT
jgi:GMP synthase (glutamine-hydrolysing)